VWSLRKSNVAAIHHIDGSGLRHDQIERCGIAHFAVRNMDKAGDWTAQIEQRVHLHGRFGRTKIGPRKQRQAQIDRRAIESINRIGEIEPDIIADV
jgi:hypothetical protein